jgi:hypothetical protein
MTQARGPTPRSLDLQTGRGGGGEQLLLSGPPVIVRVP